MRKVSWVLIGAAAGVALTLGLAPPRVAVTGADAKPVPKTELYRLLTLFGDAFERVRTDYVEKPDDGKLVISAVNGMLSNLDDSYYVDPQALNHSDVCSGPSCAGFGDIGISYTMEDGLATVVTVLDNSPAAKTELVTGDVIIRLDDHPVDGLTFRQVGTKLSGQVGSTIRLTIVHPGQDKPIDIPIVRTIPARDSVSSRVAGDDIGYIRIAQFNEATSQQLKKAFAGIGARAAPDKLKGYVLDLRNNPGGVLEDAVAAADAFLDDGEIVSVHHRATDKIERFRATAGDLAGGRPVVVLINGGSASKAEIVAAALHDNHRATLVGTRSFGKGWESTLVPLGPKKGAIRLATGDDFTPSGRLIQGNGIAPDIEVAQDIPESLKATLKIPDKPLANLQSYIPADANADKALNAAYDLLRKKSAAALGTAQMP